MKGCFCVKSAVKLTRIGFQALPITNNLIPIKAESDMTAYRRPCGYYCPLGGDKAKLMGTFLSEYIHIYQTTRLHVSKCPKVQKSSEKSINSSVLMLNTVLQRGNRRQEFRFTFIIITYYNRVFTRWQ